MADEHFKIVVIMKKKGSATILEYSYGHTSGKRMESFIDRKEISLQKDPTSIYESDWERYKCKVKKDNIVGSMKLNYKPILKFACYSFSR